MGLQQHRIFRNLAADIEIPTGSKRYKAIRYKTVGHFMEGFLGGKFVFFRMNSIEIEQLSWNRGGAGGGSYWVKWHLDFAGGTTYRPEANYRRYRLQLELPVSVYDSIWYFASMVWIRVHNSNVRITVNGADIMAVIRGIGQVRNWPLYRAGQSDIGQWVWKELPQNFKRWGFPLSSGGVQ